MKNIAIKLNDHRVFLMLILTLFMYGCSKKGDIKDEDYSDDQPEIVITDPTTNKLILVDDLESNITVRGTVSGDNLKVLSYAINDGGMIQLPSFDGSSSEFNFDMDFGNIQGEAAKDVALKVTLKNASGKEVTRTVTFQVQNNPYAFPVIQVASITEGETISIGSSLTVTGNVMASGLSSVSYNIGGEELPLTLVNNEFVEELDFSEVLLGESKEIVLAITAKDNRLRESTNKTTFIVRRDYIEPGLDPGDIGSVYFKYAGEMVKYTTVRAEDGNIWLQQNLGASRVANSITDNEAYGDHFQWGRWDDGHQKRSSATIGSDALTPNNPGGLDKSSNPYIMRIGSPLQGWWQDGTEADSWTATTPADVTTTNGCDPCKAIGPGWRLPTTKEFSNVVEKEGLMVQSKLGLAGAFASNLKIAAGGFRSEARNYVDQGSRTIITTSTPTSGNAAGGRNFTVDINMTNTRYSGVAYNRWLAPSVRCVKIP